MTFDEMKILFKDEKIALEERFIKACVLVDKLRDPLGVSTDDKLKFYGLFKQGAFGVCNYPKPNRIKVAQCELWKAWNNVKGMTKAAAQQAYIDFGLKVLSNIKGSKEAIITKICGELSEDTFHKAAIEKIIVSTTHNAPKPKLSIIDQAKQLSKQEDVKLWTAIAEKMKAVTFVASASAEGRNTLENGSSLASNETSKGVIPVTFSSTGTMVAKASGEKASDLSSGIIVMQKVSSKDSGGIRVKTA